MKHIYRVENNLGEGCYMGKQHEEGIKKAIGHHFVTDGDRKHPLLYNDEGINRESRPSEICGFLDKTQAMKWFTIKELEGLKKVGYELKKIVVKKITAIGEKQILAIK